MAISRSTGFKLLMPLNLLLAALLMTGCESEPATTPTPEPKVDVSTSNAQSSVAAYADVFAGCYTIDMSEPAQIKIAQLDDGLVMQMKEPTSAKRVWDDPEPLEVMDVGKTPDYFSIDSDKVTHLLARPDRLFVVAHIDETYANLHPLLDSDYLGFILQGANTIFKIACDDINTDLTGEEEQSNITLKPAQS